LVQKLIALKCKQKVLIFRKIYTPKFLGCYKCLVGNDATETESTFISIANKELPSRQAKTLIHQQTMTSQHFTKQEGRKINI
jgi:hypothetical protein